MYRILLFFIWVIIAHKVSAQDNYPKVVKDVCACIDKINLKSSPEVMNQKAMQCIQSEYTRQDAALKVDVQKIKKQNPALSDIECSKLLSEKILQYLMKNCISFQNISMQDNHTGPETSKAVITVGGKICDCINKKPVVNDSSVDDCINSVMESEESMKMAEEEFNMDDKKVFEQFGLRLNSYLLSKCDKYIEWTTKQMYKR
jgi:hypothetical protein